MPTTLVTRSSSRCLLEASRTAVRAALIAFAGGLAAPANAGPITLICDSFDRTGPLVGSSADTGQTWSGTGAFQTDGSRVVVDSNNAPRIGGLVLQPNKTYELCLDMDVQSGGTGWISFGFTDTSPVNSFDASPAKMHHRAISEIEVFGAGSNGQTVSATGAFPKRMSVILTTGASLSNSVVSFEENNTPIGTPISTDASLVTGVFVQANGARGLVDNLKLTCIPEPSAAVAALLLATTFAAAGMRWRLG